MHSDRKNMWSIGLTMALVILATLSCTFSDLLGVTPEIQTQDVEVTRLITVGPAEPPIDLEGVWFNPSTNSQTTILWAGDQFEVASVVDTDDGEVYPITSSDWDGSRLRWSYYVPSTNYNVTFTMTSLVGDNLNCDWFNDHERSGTRTLERR